MSDETYSGWKNYQTWNVSLWINNDQGDQEAAIEVIRDAMQGSDWDSRGIVPAVNERRYELQYAAERLREWWTDALMGEDERLITGPAADLLGHALACVDWYEVTEALAEDLPTVGGIGR